MRHLPVVAGLVLLFVQQIAPVPPLPQPPFEDWLAAVRAEALTRGIREATLDQAFTGLERVPTVIERDRTQAELVQTLDDYLAQRISKRVVLTAQTMRQTHRDVLKGVSEKYGVPASVLVSIWGLESNFGRFSGVRPTIATLATLAYDPRRSTMFRRELFDALTILDSGDVEPAAMRGSWAGALGQPQFMPSSFLLYAQDFDGDGRRDIWRSTPDVFASIANYLSAHGWNKEQAWGREVRVSAGVLARLSEAAPVQTEGCLARRQMTVPLPLATWKKLGMTTLTGSALPSADIDASLVSGVTRHFLVYPNYQALLEYNCVNAYGLSVGLLADRAAAQAPKPSRPAKAVRAPAKRRPRKS
ncbi:MAG: lytic murein transglycosylase [Vicinamibacterales bacterium]